MLRLLILFLLAHAAAFAQGQQPASRVAPSVAIERHEGNLFVLGKDFHKETAVADTSEKLNIDGGTPVYTGIVTFVFSDGSSYQCEPKEALPKASFAVLLKGEVELADARRGIGRMFTRRKSVKGDEALLRWLQTRELQSVRYEQKDTRYWNGNSIQMYLPAIVYSNPTQFAEVRRQANQ